jgi:hypothetical protein
MRQFSSPNMGAEQATSKLDRLRRKPMRVSVTLSWHLMQRLQARADEEGRSLSNLLAFLLEGASQARTQ